MHQIKDFHFFHTELPLSVLGTGNQMWTVACLLVNFQVPSILTNNVLAGATRCYQYTHCSDSHTKKMSTLHS